MKLFQDYQVTSPYGQRTDPINGGETFHSGVDMVKQHKDPILAFVGGTVVHAGETRRGTGLGGYGNVVVIKDQKGALHCYCHLHDVNVAVGDFVDAGQVIGRQGNTGRSTGSHLHYEVRKKANPLYGWGTHTDPEQYLEAYLDQDTERNKAVSPWARGARDWVESVGISDAQDPQRPATREEVWTMLHRYEKEKERKNDGT